MSDPDYLGWSPLLQTLTECGASSIDTEQDVQVRVGVAASLHKLKWTDIDLILFDEAHRHYKERRIQAFLKVVKCRHQILFTGTPATFIKDNAINKANAKIVFIVTPS